MALERLDLNLLRVFQAIDAERHVTRAAARLGVTQSAASNALARLRRDVPGRPVPADARRAWSRPPWRASWPGRSPRHWTRCGRRSSSTGRSSPRPRATSSWSASPTMPSSSWRHRWWPPAGAGTRGLGRVPARRPGGCAGTARPGSRAPGGRHLPRAADPDDPDRPDARRVRRADALGPPGGGGARSRRLSRGRRISWSRRSPAARVPSTARWRRSGARANWPPWSRTIWSWRRSSLHSDLVCTLAGRLAGPVAAAFGLDVRPAARGARPCRRSRPRWCSTTVTRSGRPIAGCARWSRRPRAPGR